MKPPQFRITPIHIALLISLLLSVPCLHAADGFFVAQWGYLRAPVSDPAARTKVIDTARQIVEAHGWTLKSEKGEEIRSGSTAVGRVVMSFEADGKNSEIEFLSEDADFTRVRVLGEPKVVQLVTSELGTQLKLKPMEAR